MNKEDYKGVFVFVQQVDNKISNVSFELLGKGKELANDLNTEVTAVVLGSKIFDMAQEVARHGADRVIIVDNISLKTYQTEAYAYALCEIVKLNKPEILLIGATAIGRDLAPRISANIHTGLTADCTGLCIDKETNNLMMTRPAFGGNIMATILCPDYRPQMATVRPGVMKKLQTEENKKIPTELSDVMIGMKPANIEILEIVKTAAEKMDIQDAKILVSGGRGMGCPENFKLLNDLAETLGGSVSSSRACVDAGWIEKDCQVGQTGKTVRPNLYIACGISGAIQHIAGMEDADVIIAINKDETAPIFSVADFGVVGDVTKILPIFTETLKKELATH